MEQKTNYTFNDIEYELKGDKLHITLFDEVAEVTVEFEVSGYKLEMAFPKEFAIGTIEDWFYEYMNKKRAWEIWDRFSILKDENNLITTEHARK